MKKVGLAVAYMLLWLIGCTKTPPKVTCSDDTSCTVPGRPGICLPEHVCAVPDPSCLSGYRYDATSGKGECVPLPSGTDLSMPADMAITDDMASSEPGDMVSTDMASAITNLTFGTATHYSTVGKYPSNVAVGDINGDGSADVAVSDSETGNIYVLVNKKNGTGMFNAPIPVNAGSVLPYGVVIADFNGDGKADLATADNLGSMVVILQTDTGWASPASYAAAKGPHDIALGDFNGDGKIDLATANSNAANVTVFLNAGNGTFAAAVPYAAGSGATTIESADFNGDGKVDLVVGNYNANNISVHINNGNGTFAMAASYSNTMQPNGSAVGIFKGAKPDIVIAANGEANTNVYLNNGVGTFPATPAKYASGTGTADVATGDFNKDGKLDFVVLNADGFKVFINDGNGNFTAAPQVPIALSGGKIFQEVAVGDFNGDSLPDVAALAGDGVNIVLNTSM